MIFLPSPLAFFRMFTVFLLTALVVACGGGGSESPTTPPPSLPPPNTLTDVPLNQISQAYFRDQDSSVGELGGVFVVNAPEIVSSDTARTQSVWVYWADEQGNKVGEPWLKTNPNGIYDIEISEGTVIPNNISAMLLYPSNEIGLAAKGSLIAFNDFTGNAALTGPGGNEINTWHYGDDRPSIAIQRTEEQGGLCIFDNGLVSVINMQNTRDDAWDTNSGNGLANTADDTAFPAFEFLCSLNPVHSSDDVADEFGVWTHSTLNDSMFYGTIVYDTFLKYLGEPPLAEKIRLRVHYGALSDDSAYWDGAYANFGDAFLRQYSMASLDSIAHEVGHGVLNRISDLDFFNTETSTDARTLHEAFADISGVMAKYDFDSDANIWTHGEESHGRTRQLDKIKTETEAIDSLLDYNDAGDNYYLRIGMISYPFYLLSNKWGLEPTYSVYLSAARNCWSATTTLTEAAECVKTEAMAVGLAEADVIDAFKTVKIKLFEEGVLSHFDNEIYKLRAEFVDDSRSTNQVAQWLWDFGDGQTSTETNPQHTYSEAGDYNVSLTVTDQSDDQDTFSRVISVTDQYCSIKPNPEPDNEISRVVIDNQDIYFSPTESDYTETLITLTNPSNVTLDIQGNTDVTERSTTWRIWIDLDDNGVFGNNEQELILDIRTPEGQPYSLNSVIDLSTLPNDGNPKTMRVKGNYASTSPCNKWLGEAFDVRVQW